MVRKCASSLLLMMAIAAAHGQATVTELFDQLVVSEMTATAASELQSRASSDPSVQSELETRLPHLLSGPPALPTVWASEVKLAGDAHVVSCLPILAAWVKDSVGLQPVHTATKGLTQEGDLPAAALVQIGEPAVPALSEITKTGSRSAQQRAALILRRINTTKSNQAYQAYVATIQDERLRHFLSTRDPYAHSPR